MGGSAVTALVGNDKQKGGVVVGGSQEKKKFGHKLKKGREICNPGRRHKKESSMKEDCSQKKGRFFFCI